MDLCIVSEQQNVYNLNREDADLMQSTDPHFPKLGNNQQYI